MLKLKIPQPDDTFMVFGRIINSDKAFYLVSIVGFKVKTTTNSLGLSIFI